MRVLITGHRGYIGTVLVPVLRDAGHDVTGMDIDLYADCLLGPEPPETPTLPVDIRDVDADTCRGFDAVVHLAALCNDPIGNLDPDLTFDINHRATVRLAQAAKSAGVSRFLFSSSCSLYGAGEGDQPLTEDAPTSPVTPYGSSKIWSEDSLAAMADATFCPVFLRNATAYGYSPRLRGDLVLNDLVAHALLVKEVRLRSDGSAWRPLVHVEDIARAFLALLDAPRQIVSGNAYNVGRTQENYQIRAVAALVAEAVPDSRVTYIGTATKDLRNYRVSCDRIAHDVPGYQPTWTVRAGIQQLLDAYRDYGLTLDDLMGERYQRLQRITALRAAGRLDDSLRWIGATHGDRVR